MIRGIGVNGSVWLADPSWGNRHFSKHQFLSMWETRDGESLKGKILLLLPDGIDINKIKPTFFSLTHASPMQLEMVMLRN